MARTPWTHASSLPSDRIKPKPAPQPQGGGKSKAKGKNKDAGPPRSAAVQKLEKMIADLEASTSSSEGGDIRAADAVARDKGKENACFCQGAFIHCKFQQREITISSPM